MSVQSDATATDAPRVGEKTTGTKALIDDAKEAAEIKADADAAAATAQQAARDAATELATMNQAVHDDLVANGSALYLEGEAYFIATAAEPADYTLTPIRIA